MGGSNIYNVDIGVRNKFIIGSICGGVWSTNIGEKFLCLVDGGRRSSSLDDVLDVVNSTGSGVDEKVLCEDWQDGELCK